MVSVKSNSNAEMIFEIMIIWFLMKRIHEITKVSIMLRLRSEILGFTKVRAMVFLPTKYLFWKMNKESWTI